MQSENAQCGDEKPNARFAAAQFAGARPMFGLGRFWRHLGCCDLAGRTRRLHLKTGRFEHQFLKERAVKLFRRVPNVFAVFVDKTPAVAADNRIKGGGESGRYGRAKERQRKMFCNRVHFHKAIL